MTPKTNKVGLTLIHNFDSARTSSALWQLQKFRNLANRTQFRDIELIGWQPDLIPANLGLVIRKELATLAHLIRWKKYLSSKQRLSKSNFAPLISSTARLIGSPFSHTVYSRTRAIEIELTLKHVRAWEAYLETDAEWLLVAEDDIVLSKNPELLINQLEDFLRDSTPQESNFISLSGPYSTSELNASDLTLKRHSYGVAFTRPLTNTTACYILSRKAAETFATEFRRDCRLRLLSADLMMNEIFIRAVRNSHTFNSIHFDPEIFENGTMSGRLQTSIH